MTNKKRTAKLLVGLLMASMLLTGCGAASKGAMVTSNNSSASIGYDTGYESEDAMPAEGVSSESALLTEQEVGERKIIYTADASMETEKYEETVSAIKELLKQKNGYISSTSESGSAEDRDRYAYLTCRVPADEYQSFLEGLSGTGNVYSLSQNTDDITTQYIDVDARISSLEQQRDRLRELAEEAEDIDTLLSIEDKLGDVQYELESYTAQMRSMENQLTYSTVDLSIREVAKVSEGTVFSARIRAAFSGSWTDFVTGVQDAVIAVIYALPMLIILGILAAVIIPLVRRHHRKVKAHLAQNLSYRSEKADKNSTTDSEAEGKSSDTENKS